MNKTRIYGTLIYNEAKGSFAIIRLEPHVSIKLKSIFHKVAQTQVAPFYFKVLPDVCIDLIWFMDRYPMEVADDAMRLLKSGKKSYLQKIAELDRIHLPGYAPKEIKLKDGWVPRHYQLTGNETYMKMKRLLLGDDIGVGKTLTAILSFLNPKTLPAAVVVWGHLTYQWEVESIQSATNLRTHVITGGKIYDLPEADVYIFKYSIVAKWVEIFKEGIFRSVIFDEAQELRRTESKKYQACKVLSNCVDYAMGLTATPVYNYGDEMFNVLDLINPGCLGRRDDFLREWATYLGGNKYKIIDPVALGAYLRENWLFLRRTRKDVGRELPPVNKIIHTVDYDITEVAKVENLAVQLAMKIRTGSFTERGEASRALDMLARRVTGVSKAIYVAEYVKFLVESGFPVVLAGWHREVYTKWLDYLKDYHPVMYTGSETPAQKNWAKNKFVSGESKIFIISLRSGVGLDGLQYMCENVVIGELDWSPEVIKQLIGRVDRDGNEKPVNAHYLISNYGSDPPIVSLLGLKASQADGIINPFQSAAHQHSDESRMKLLADQYLKKKELTLFE